MSFDPISLATIGKVVGVASSIFGTVSSMQAASYQAAVAERNQRLAEENAARAVETSQLEAQDWGESARQQLGNMVAELSASGGRVGAGTSLLQRRAAESLSRRDAGRIREQGNTRADAFSQQAADFGAEAGQAKRRQGFALISGGLGALDSFVSGATRTNRTRGLMS